MTIRNHVWSNNGDIANDLEWPLTAPSTPFYKFWGFCFFSLLNIYLAAMNYEEKAMTHIGLPNRTES